MNKNQSFNLDADFLSGFSSLFVKLVMVIIFAYFLIMVLNFLRDKFLNKEVTTKNADITDLLIILNKLFTISGIGFIIGNLFQFPLSRMWGRNTGMPTMNLQGDWDYLAFGIILIFVGIGFKAALKALKKAKE